MAQEKLILLVEDNEDDVALLHPFPRDDHPMRDAALLEGPSCAPPEFSL